MKLRQISFKIISLVMVVAMMFGMSATTISAVAADIENNYAGEKEDLIYVSLGDSTTNGYGLTGYEFEQNEEFNAIKDQLYKDHPTYDGEKTLENPNGLLMETPGAYPALFRDYLQAKNPDKNVNLIQLAVSAMRADDVLTMLTIGTDEHFDLDDYSGNKFNEKYVIHNYSEVAKDLPFEWEFDLNNVEESMGKLYQESVRNADVVSINLGSNNFSIYMWGCLGPMIMGMMGQDESVSYVPMMDELLATVDNEELTELTKKVYGEIKELLVEKLDGFIEDEDLMTGVENLADYGAYTFLSYCITYTKLLDRVNELNSNADIILIPPVNFMKGFTIDIGNNKLVDMSEFISYILEAGNLYVSTMATVKDADFENDIFWADHGGMVDMLMAEMVELEATNFNGAEVLHSRLITSLIDWVNQLSGGAFDLNDAGVVTREAVAAYKDKDIEYFQKKYQNKNPYDMVYYIAFVGAYVGMEKALITSSQMEAVDVNLFLDILNHEFTGKVTDVFTAVGDTVAASAAQGGGELFGGANNADTLFGIGDAVAAILNGNETAQGMLYVMAYFMVADGVVCHPSAKGYKTVAQAMIDAYDNGFTVLDQTINNAVDAAEILADLIAEYYDEAYAYGYAELAAAGYIDLADEKLGCAIYATQKLIQKLSVVEVDAEYREILGLVVRELNLINTTLSIAQDIIKNPEIDDEMISDLEYLVDDLKSHCETLSALANEFVSVSDRQLAIATARLEAHLNEQVAIINAKLEADIAALEAQAQSQIATLKTQAHAQINILKAQFESEVANLEENAKEQIADVVNSIKNYVENIDLDTVNNISNFVNELDLRAYAQLANILYAEYGTFVNIAVNALAYHSHEGAKYLYNWLTNNPETVIAFFAENGDEIGEFLADNGMYVLYALGYVAQNYGEDILYLVLDNSDIILPAVAEWFSDHGSLVWDLLVVYFDAIVDCYDLGIELDFSSLENITKSFCKIFDLVDDLVSMIADDVYDYVDGLNVMEQIKTELVNLALLLNDTVKNHIDNFDSLVNEKIEALNTKFQNQITAIQNHVAEMILALEAEGQAQIDALKAQAQAQIDALKAQAQAQIDALKAQLENAVGEAKDKIEAEIARIEAQLAAEIARVEAQVQAQIDAVKAHVQAQIDALKAQAQAQIDALKAELESLVEMEINNAKDAVAALDKLLYNGVKALGEYIYGEIVAFVDNAVRGVYTPDEHTNIVSVSSGNALYAEYLKDYINGMYADTKYPYSASLDNMTWDALEYDKLAAADLVTIGFEEKEISAFALNQMLAYVANFIDTDLRTNTEQYIDDVFVELNKAVEGKLDIDFNDYKETAHQAINDTIDNNLVYSMIADKELADMDWSKYVGNADSYVDQLRAYLKAKLINAGIEENYYYTIDVVDYLYSNAEDLGIDTVLNFIVKDYAYEVLGDKAYYSIEIPVVDTVVFALESYLYANVKLQGEYAKLIVDLYKINPDATVVLLSHYNPYDIEFNIGGVAINPGDLYVGMTGLYSFQPLAYALLSEKVLYVDIYNAETGFDPYDGEEDNVVFFLLDLVFEISTSDITDDGHYYIFEQILNVLTIGCEHVYANGCDTDCDRCGAVRPVAGHKYNNCEDTTCNICGAVRVAPGHNYGDDDICDDCGYQLPGNPIVQPTPPAELDPECVAGNHYYDNCDDTTCYKCGNVRAPIAHSFDCVTGECANCDVTITAGSHVYTNAHDKTCEVCGATRNNVPACEAVTCTDTTCKVCGATIKPTQHVFGEWVVKYEVTRDSYGYEYHDCKICGIREHKLIKPIGGLGVAAIVGIVIGSVIVAGAAGFAIFWFLIQKKTFAALMEAVKALVAKLSNPEAPAVAEAAEADAEAPATEEETK